MPILDMVVVVHCGAHCWLLLCLETIDKFHRESLKMPKQNKMQMTLQNALCIADVESDCRTTSGAM